MKLSNHTLTVLKNFAAINAGIEFKEGNVLSTVSPQKNVLAETTLTDSFPVTFCIYDLNNFLSVLSIHKEDVELEFDESHVIVIGKKGRSKIKYRFTSSQMIVRPPEKKISLPSVDVYFGLTVEDYDWINNTAKTLQSPNIGVESDGETVSLVTFDFTKDDAHKEYLEIAKGNGDTYLLVFNTDNFNKLLTGVNYSVDISSKGISHFSSSNEVNPIDYWIALEKGTKFQKA